MRLAIVAASSYEKNGQVAPIPNAEIDVELFGRRLADPDAGFTVHAFDAVRGLAEGVEELARSVGGRLGTLVFYFWGYALLSEERGPTLLLDGPKLSTFSLARLRRVLNEVAEESLVVLDTTLAEGSAGAALDVVRAMGTALSGPSSTISTIAAVRPQQQKVVHGPPPFTGLVQMVLDGHTGSQSALTPETLFRAMQAEEVMFADIPAAGCFLAERDFVIVPGATLPSPSALPPRVTLPPPGVPPAALAYDDAEEITAPRGSIGSFTELDQEPPTDRELDPVPRSETSVPPAPPPRSEAEALSALFDDVGAGEPPTTPDAAPAPTPHLSEQEAQRALLKTPESAEAHRALYACFEKRGDQDSAYRAAACLEALGEADINESLLATTHRPDGLLPVRGTLSYADWNQSLCAGYGQPETLALLRALGPALNEVGHQHARRQRRPTELPDDARQDPEKSTTTLAKTLLWASRLLCVPAPELYVLPEVEGALSLIAGRERVLFACARSLGSGFSLPELVFLWSRQLAFARPEESALSYFPTPSELSQLLLAALAVGGATDMRAIDGDAKRIASGLKREVRGAALDALRAAARGFEPREVGARATHFMRSAEIVASRVGLVASGNLELSLALGQRFPLGALTRADERRADLLRFNVSPELGRIRAALGIAISRA